MYNGIVDSETLHNPTMLNGVFLRRVVIERVPVSTIGKYHHEYFINIMDRDIKKIIKKTSKHLRKSCYAIFWNNRTVFVVFARKYFELVKKDFGRSTKYNALVKYARKHGVQNDYLNFTGELEKFNNNVNTLNKGVSYV